MLAWFLLPATKSRVLINPAFVTAITPGAVPGRVLVCTADGEAWEVDGGTVERVAQALGFDITTILGDERFVHKAV